MSKLSETLGKAWPACELPGYREHPQTFATYSGFSFENLPPVAAEADEEFQWLKGEPEKSEWSLQDESGELPAKLRDIEASVPVRLPASFLAFLRSPDLQARVRSCTACYLELPDHIVPVVGPEHGFLIHFLSDQQWCLHWSLFLNETGEHCVICSEEAYGFDEAEEGEQASGGPHPVDLGKDGATYCAPSFPEFLYRFWIENEIYFHLSDEVPLSAKQQAYLEHYH